jgi:hypothetical protein
MRERGEASGRKVSPRWEANSDGQLSEAPTVTLANLIGASRSSPGGLYSCCPGLHAEGSAATGQSSGIVE